MPPELPDRKATRVLNVAASTTTDLEANGVTNTQYSTITVRPGVGTNNGFPHSGIGLSSASVGFGGEGLTSLAQMVQVVRPSSSGGGSGYHLANTGGGLGGGCLIIAVIGHINITAAGIISATGTAGTNPVTTGTVAGPGGGGGVVILLATNGIALAGTIDVSGGAGGPGFTNNPGSTLAYGGGGGGGGGAIFLLSTPSFQTNAGYVTNVNGGAGGASSGSGATVSTGGGGGGVGMGGNGGGTTNGSTLTTTAGNQGNIFFGLLLPNLENYLFP